MNYRIISPGQQLSAFIKYYWTLCCVDGSQISQRVHPTGETQIILHFGRPFIEFGANGREDLQSAGIVCGQMTGFKDVGTTGVTDMIGIVFQPFGLRPFLCQPMAEFTDRTVDIHDVWCSFYKIQERIGEICGLHQRIAVIEMELIRFYNINDVGQLRSVSYSVSQMSRQTAPLCLGKFNREIGVSDRQQERLFREYVGLSPKQYYSVIRFMRAVELLKGQQSLTRIATRSGYYDQAHFIRDFRSFSGLTPGVYRRTYCDIDTASIDNISDD